MDTMYKLTKQIDALTYNSRAVLNALVRSCIAAGSSNGFRITRFETPLTLDRADIYRLYDFYQTWANGTAGYEPYTKDPEEFAAIVEICDSKWKEPGLVISSIVTHSKILYMISSNKNNNSTDYWLGLIRDSSSPKLVTNSAPIPLNLRTPLYDADLSTKSFSQYETYLFPSGYSKISITGMPGDGEDHVGGGKSWTWDIDESLDVTAPRVRFGFYTDTDRRIKNYRDTLYSFSFGYDTYALGERSASIGGLNNMAYGVNSATIGGTELMALGKNSVIAGGETNATVRDNTFAFGRRTHAIGPQSMAGNELTRAGCYSYHFTIEEPENSGSVVDCEVIRDETTGQCIDISSSISSGEGRSTIRISYNQVASNGMWYLNMEVGDTVTVYAQTRKEGTGTYAGYETEGYVYEPLKFTVTNISRDNGDFLVQLNGGIPRGEDGLGTTWVNGGYVATTWANYREQDWSGTLTQPVEWIPGHSSNALNYNTYAPGVHQTVVGQMNYGDRDAKFVVGTGSSYVGYDSYRRNGLAVAQGYGYMQTASRSAIIGVSDYGLNTYRDFNGRYLRQGAWMFHNGESDYEGHVVANDVATDIGMSKFGTSTEDNRLIFVRPGTSYLSATHDVTVCLEARAGTMVITSGSYVGAEHSYDVLLSDGVLRGSEGGDVAIYSENGMELRNTNSSKMMSFHNSGYIMATFSGLFLHGNTWGTLATTDSALSHLVYHNNESNYTNAFNTPGHDVNYINSIAQSGFFYGDIGDRNLPIDSNDGKVLLPKHTQKILGGDWEPVSYGGLHIINSAVKKVYSGKNMYDVACLAMPGNMMAYPGVGITIPHIKFVTSTIYGTGNGGTEPIARITEELAYVSDVEQINNFSKTVGCIALKVMWRTLKYGLTGEGTIDDPFRFSFPKDFNNYYEDGGSVIAHPFSYGTVLSHSGVISRMSYFNVYDESIMEAKPTRWVGGNVTIAAPLDNYGNITLVRNGQMISMTITVTVPPRTQARQVHEVMVNLGPASSVLKNPSVPGILGYLEFPYRTSVVLTGAGMNGIKAMCTISNNLTNSAVEHVNDHTRYSTENMLDFFFFNPGGDDSGYVTDTITLTGTITRGWA